MASLDGVDSCGGSTNHVEGPFAAGFTLTSAIPVRNTPMLLKAPTLAALCLTLWSVVVDERLGTGEPVDGLALGELGSALRRIVFMLGAPTGVARR